MRFEKVKLTFGSLDSYTFPLNDEIMTSPYVVTDIDGLDPPVSAVSIVNSLYEGGTYQGRRPENREIVMMISFHPDYSVGQNAGDLRSELYNLLTPKLGQLLVFSILDGSNNVLAYTSGVVKSCPANIFAKDPTIQVSIPCTSPYLMADRYTYPSPGTMTKSPLTISNSGNAPTGWKFKATLTAAATSFTITNDTNTERLTFTYAFSSGDIIDINTHAGSRVATVTRAGVVTNLLRVISTTSTWFQLHGGTNVLRPSTANFTLNEISYIPRYWGV